MRICLFWRAVDLNLCTASAEKLSGIKIQTVEELKMKRDQEQQPSPGTVKATTKGLALVSEKSTIQQATPATISPPPSRPSIPTIVKPTIPLSALHQPKRSGNQVSTNNLSVNKPKSISKPCNDESSNGVSSTVSQSQSDVANSMCD